MKKDCEPLTPSFKVRILIPLPRENRHPHGCLLFSIEEDKDSKNRYYEEASNKVLNACVQVLIPLPQKRAENSALFFFCPALIFRAFFILAFYIVYPSKMQR